MTALRIEIERLGGQCLRVDPDRSTQRFRERCGRLLDVDRQYVIVPSYHAWPDRKRRGRPLNARATSFGHRPVLSVFSVKRNVHRAVIQRVAVATSSHVGVVGRKYAADESDDGYSIAAICAQSVDIPPDISARRNWPIEAKSVSIASAASQPEIAAIGTPGPGCVLPPAR
jgi:hypothetical protein